MLINRLSVLFYATAMLAACDNHSATALAAPTPDKAVVYELRNRCGRDAREWFAYARQSGQLSAEEGIISSEFENHYNAHLNKCFLFATSAVQDPVHPNAVNTRFQLFDIGENVEVAQRQMMVDTTGPTPVIDQVMTCSIGGKYCGEQFSADQWRQAVRPYMEE
jgi:hypothetical protein